MKSNSHFTIAYNWFMFLIMPLLFLLQACSGNQTPAKTDDAASENTESIFNLQSTWRTEENKEITLKALNGKVLCVVMIYTSCKVACPRLVSDMKAIAAKIPEKYKQDIQYVLVSIDPETDTPQKLKQFAIDNQMDGLEWTFLQGTKNSVREFANVLAVKYKEISPKDFSHSNIISVFNRNGVLLLQQEGLGLDNSNIVNQLMEASQTKQP